MALNALPSTLDENYEEAMKRIERSPNKSLALNVLKWIVYAVRPLQLEEVLHAIAVDDLEPEDESVTKDCLTPPGTIVNACAGMIRIDKESDQRQRNGAPNPKPSGLFIAETQKGNRENRGDKYSALGTSYIVRYSMISADFKHGDYR